MKGKILFLATRPGFFTASTVSVLLGLAVAWRQAGELDWLAAAGVLLASLLMHAGADMINDYHDHVNGADEANHEYISPFTGGSRMIQCGLLSPAEVRRTALVLLGAGAAVLALLALREGPGLWLLAAIGVASSLAYTGRPLYLASRGLGELVVGLNFGPVLVAAGYYVQAHALPAGLLLTSLPLGLLVTAILYVNEMPDYAGDRAAGKRTLVVRLGRQRASWGYALLVALAYLSIVAGVLARQLPPEALIALASLPLGVAAAANVRRHYDDPVAMSPASVQTIVNHLLTGLLLVVSFLGARALWPLVVGAGCALLLAAQAYGAMDAMRRGFLAQRQER
ncbi:MAG: 1,4-dihydroxy-2-naphthoate octaprenyltransferase [Anaerolineae bacterium]|nr:1,4-dihydroxy-2-naphthoate octaprenyltransferase [Anaerolineae bacterium]